MLPSFMLVVSVTSFTHVQHSRMSFQTGLLNNKLKSFSKNSIAPNLNKNGNFESILHMSQSNEEESGSREENILSEAAKAKGRVDSETRKKLLAESIAPWRGLRLFFYAALASGAALGGFITLSGVIAGLSGVRTDLDLNTEYLNLAIDFGAVLVFLFLAKFDLDKKAALETKVEDKLAKKKEQNKISKSMRAREKNLLNLKISIRVSVDGNTQEATVGAVQEGANQHMIFVIGNKKCIKDALLGANLLKLDFSMSNILVVPYEIGASEEEKKTRPQGGFGERPIWETQPYVAEVTGPGWDDHIREELKDAVEQSGPMVKQEGIAIVLANDGTVIRRGVGKVPWRQMVEELEQRNAVPEKEKEYGLL